MSSRPLTRRRDDPIVDLGRFEGIPAHQKVLTMLLLSGFAQGATEICLASRVPGADGRDVRVAFRLDAEEGLAQPPPEGVAEHVVRETQHEGDLIREYPPLPGGVAPFVLGEIRRLAGLDSWCSRIKRIAPRGAGKGSFRIRVEEPEREIIVEFRWRWRATIHVLAIGWHRCDPPA